MQCIRKKRNVGEKCIGVRWKTILRSRRGSSKEYNEKSENKNILGREKNGKKELNDTIQRGIVYILTYVYTKQVFLFRVMKNVRNFLSR